MDLETLREWKREGRLIADNDLRTASNGAWVKASTVRELFEDSSVEKPPPLFMRRRTFGGIIAETFNHASSEALRRSLSPIKRPSRFHSRKVSRSTGPYSLPCTRTNHSSSGIAALNRESRESPKIRECFVRFG